jgi:hypothetical protein
MQTELPSSGAEADAWARVLAAWQDEAAHRAYLAGCNDLEALAVAGGRYREVLAVRPDDPLAARFRDEVVKKATVVGLSTLPRTSAPRIASGFGRKLLVAACILLGILATLLAYRLYRTLSGGPLE